MCDTAGCAETEWDQVLTRCWPLGLPIEFPCCLRLASLNISITRVVNSCALNLASFCRPWMRKQKVTSESSTMSLKTRERLNLCPWEPTCLVPCWWILWIHRKERHHRRLRHQRAVILRCQPHCRYYWKKETWVYCRRNTAGGFLVRSHGTFLLNLRRSLVGLPRRTRPWLAPQISDYWAAWKSGENNTLNKSKQKTQRAPYHGSGNILTNCNFFFAVLASSDKSELLRTT